MARDFPGATTTDYLITGASAVFNFNTNVCWWAVVLPDSFAGGQPLIAQAGTSARGTSASFGNTGLQKFGKEGVGGVTGTATTQLSTGVWYAVQMQSTAGGDAKFKRYQYSNTTLASETVTNTTTINIPVTDALIVGNFMPQGTTLAFNGLIDRVALLQADPTDAEFLAWAITGKLPAGLTYKFYTILWDASPTGDLSGNGNNLTVTGTLPVVPGGPVSLFTRISPFLGAITGTVAQLARPSTDTTVDNWEDQAGGTTDLYATLNETVADDANYIRTQLSPTNDVYVTKLTPVNDPLVSTGYRIRYRYGKSAAGGQQINQTIGIYQDYVNEGDVGTFITNVTHTDVGVFPIAATLEISGAAADLVTDHTNLFIRILANAP